MEQEDNKEYIVYMHIFPDGKRYIGITKDIEHRWIGNGSSYCNHGRIKEAIKKYDWKNEVKHVIIAENLSKYEAEQMEIDLISKYKTTEKNYGYNVHKGGNGSKKIVQYDKTMKLIKVWDSANEASRELNIKTSGIFNCIKGRQRTAGGFIWKNYDGDDKVKITKKSW